MSGGGMSVPLLRESRQEGEEEVEVLHREQEARGHPSVGILGSGDFSRSLSARLLASGHRALVGSRDPSRLPGGLFPRGAELVSQREAVLGAERVVFAAVFPEHYPSLGGLREALAGKVLVDVSNAQGTGGGPEGSNAQRLARLFPQSHVVKGFNVVSAWALQTGAHDGSRQVLICGDCPDSKAAVVQLAHRMGFSPLDMGCLGASGAIEERVLFPYLDHGQNNFYQLPLETVNQTLPAVAMVTLALVYLPGLLAAGLQLSRGTKYSRFPSWLDRWLGSRKQLGLLSFLCAGLHAIYSMCLSVKEKVPNSWVEQNVWRSDLYLSCGILGFGVLSLLAITSLPSVGNTLNWREFTLVQSGLGYAALTLAVMHALFFGWDMAFSPGSYSYYLPPLFLLALVLPCLVLVGRLLLALPCLASRLARIRRGWESKRPRPPPTDQEAGGTNGVVAHGCGIRK
ncbi:hypothetical protein NHX12_007540 [Muraenolepis orangiensis]|uniref:Metalloreductase STEAP3 n=1 Tax=Muraenolepis orangiensis TaxID=630683 RepID=A0A9Q0DRT4_9TELE|nr:hypothetical protein NHX12_007540 [Muraenolepis orangiensis]